MHIHKKLVLSFVTGIAFGVCAGSASATPISDSRGEEKLLETARGVPTALDHVKVDDLLINSDEFGMDTEKARRTGLKEEARPFVQLDGKDVPALDRARIPTVRHPKSQDSVAVPDRSSTGLLLLPAISALLILKIIYRRRSRLS